MSTFSNHKRIAEKYGFNFHSFYWQNSSHGFAVSSHDKAAGGGYFIMGPNGQSVTERFSRIDLAFRRANELGEN